MTGKRRNLPQRFLVCLFCSCSLLVADEAESVELDAEFSAGVGRTDNVGRTSDNKLEETIGVAGFNFGLTEDTSQLTADIRSQFDYLYYADKTFDNELVGGLRASLDYTLVDERLIWILQNNYGQQPLDPIRAEGPGNRENVNYFTTGPTLSLLPGSRNLVQVELRYSSVNYERRDDDNERASALLRIGREIRRGATLSLNARTERVEFDNDGLTPDFDRLEGFVRYEFAGNRNRLGVDLGYTEIDIDGETGDGQLLRLSWTRDISASSTFVLAGGTRYSDQGDIFRFYQNISTNLRDTNSIVPSTDPFTSTYFTISYDLNRDRTSVGLGFDRTQEDYEGRSSLDNDTTRANLVVRRDISRRVYARFVAQYQRRDFKYVAVLNEDVSATAEFGYRFTPSLSVSLEYRHLDRSATDSFFDYRENRVFLRFAYSPPWGQ